MSHAQLTTAKFLLFLPAILVLSIPIFYFLYALKKKKISDWEMTGRQERYPIYLLSLLCGGLALIFVSVYGSRELFTLSLILYLVGILVTLINFFWKISTHTAGITSGALAFNLLFPDAIYQIFYLLIPLVVWSRWEEKKHTFGQLLGGIVLGALVAVGVWGAKG